MKISNRSLRKIVTATGLTLVVLSFSNPALAKKVPASQLSSSTPAAPSAPPLDINKIVGYDKGLFIATEDEKFKMKFNVQLQPQYQFLAMKNQQDVNSFQLRRSRFTISGTAFNPNLSYKIESELASGRSNTTTEGVALTGFNLREAYVEYKINDHFQVRGGEFKVMNNREEFTSSTQFQFVDQSINNDVFTLSYDLGAAVLGKFGPMDKIDYAVYVADEGNNRNVFDFNNEKLVGGRVTWNVLGAHGYTQSDVMDSHDPQLAIGAAGSWNKPGQAANNTMLGGTADVAFRYRGFSIIGEGNYARNSTAGLTVYGGLAQAGYFLIPKHLELAARGAAVIPAAAGVTNGYEVGGAFNYFFYGHNVKLQTDYAMLRNSPLTFGGGATAKNFMTTGANPTFTSGQTDHRIREQLQLYF